MLRYLSLDIIRSSKLAVFLELRSRKTVRFSERIIGVANGPLKTHGLAKFSPNFTRLVVSFFSGYVRLAVSIFLTKLSRSLDFFQG